MTEDRNDPLLDLVRDVRNYVGLLDRCGLRCVVPAKEIGAALDAAGPVGIERAAPAYAPEIAPEAVARDEGEAAPTPPSESADPAHEPLVAGVGNDLTEEIPPPSDAVPVVAVEVQRSEAAAEPEPPRDAEGQLDLFAVMEEAPAYRAVPVPAFASPRLAPPATPHATPHAHTASSPVGTGPPPPPPPPPPLPPLLTLSRDEGVAALDALSRTVAACRLCALCEGRTQTVFGEGDPEARLMFIGEGPGYNEDQQGRPFVGRAGQLLDKMIVAMGLAREQVFIANAVKCRPPENRTPTPDECAACEPYLRRQIELIRPEVICLLGATASKLILRTNAPMYAMRGQWHAYEGIPVRVTYHPAYLLRTPGDKPKAWEDLKVVMERLGLTPRAS